MTADGVPVLPPDLSGQSKILSLTRKHLLTLDETAIWDDANRLANQFVELVVDSATKNYNDAQLWAASIRLLRPAIEGERQLTISRQLVAIVRRVRHPEQRVFAPGDALPLPPPKKMSDLDGDLWIHQDNAGRGCYRMSAADRRRNRSSAIGEYEGVKVWPFLLDAEGPMTEVTAKPKPATNEGE
ncbi:hypothetical protein [Lentzea sp. NPDC092896]|uniref:hypothetical protein n=1 Tax=Lentzea sp. NPDC092896 TaxID=3364127 RepID=UPI0037FE924C